MANDLGFEETELRLGLPGGGGGGGGELGGEGRSSSSSFGKRGFAETIDLKLKLEPASSTPAADVVKDEQDDDDGVAVAKEAAVAAAEEQAGGKMKRSPSQSSVVTIAAAVQADPAEKPRAPKIREDSSAGERGEGEPIAEFLRSHGYYLNNLGEGRQVFTNCCVLVWIKSKLWASYSISLSCASWE